jgi:dTDP-4-amino-4,6-dideoxygalactose transaminase
VNIPFVDLKSLHSQIRGELREVFERVMDNSSFVLGPEVEQFEAEFADYVGARYCVALNSGTAALQLSLASLGVGPLDEVITVPHTFIATAEAITALGARPVFVDIDPVSYTMNPALLEAAITSRTRAIIPVQLYGQMADMDPILEIASEHGIPVVEDACQAHGAVYKGQRAGTFGAASCFSFYPGKNLGACGEGGAVTTNDPELAQTIRLWREHGSSTRYEHLFPGLNMRMEGLQGGFLRVKLKYLDEWNSARRLVAMQYRNALADTDLQLPVEMSYGRHMYHLYVVQSDSRDDLRRQFTEAGIETGLHYPKPLHLQRAYQSLGYKEGSFPVTERATRRILSLPMHPCMSPAMVERVAACAREACYVR